MRILWLYAHMVTSSPFEPVMQVDVGGANRMSLIRMDWSVKVTFQGFLPFNSSLMIYHIHL